MITLMQQTSRALVASVAVALTTSVASAGHYKDVDDHAREIRYEASRMERTVRYSFRQAPLALYKCLREELCALEETADCLRDLTRREGNLERIVDASEKMDAQFAALQDHMSKLERWVAGIRADCSPYSRSRSCSSSIVILEHQLKRLCVRMKNITEKMRCMLEEIDQLVAACRELDRRSQRDRGRDVAPPRGIEPSRRSIQPVQPILPPTQSRFGPRHGHYRQRTVSVPLFRHNGRYFSLAFSLDR